MSSAAVREGLKGVVGGLAIGLAVGLVVALVAWLAGFWLQAGTDRAEVPGQAEFATECEAAGGVPFRTAHPVDHPVGLVCIPGVLVESGPGA